MTEREQYMQAYATVLDLEVATVKEYMERKGMLALIKDPDELLQTKEQREKHEAFLKLYHFTVRVIGSFFF